jgi:type IV fimbrial biogenesis protein FimT
MCRSADGTSCAASGGWEQGWIVFQDLNGDGQAQADAGETIVQRGAAVGGGLLVRGTQQLAGALTFTAMGGMRAVSGGLQAGTITLCRPQDAPGAGRQVIIGSGGRARVVQVTLESCP